MHVFPHDQLNRADERRFHGGDVNLAVSLARMAIARQKQRAARVNGNEEHRARDQFLVVEITRVNPRRRAAYPARHVRQRDAEASEERPQRYFYSIREAADHSLLVERDDLYFRIWKVLGEKAPPGTKCVVRIRYRKLDRLDADFEDVPRLGALDEDRPGQYVPAWSFVGDFLVDVTKRLFNLFRWNTGAFETQRT